VQGDHEDGVVGGSFFVNDLANTLGHLHFRDCDMFVFRGAELQMVVNPVFGERRLREHFRDNEARTTTVSLI